MWKRFMRVLRSFFGGAVSAMENPKMVLEQNLRDLRDQIPKMNNSIAMVKANETTLTKDRDTLQAEVNDLTAKIRAGIQSNREDIAGHYATQLQTKKAELSRVGEQLVTAKAAVEKAMQVKAAFMKNMDRKTKEAQEALREHERGEWQAKIADTMESFQVAGVDATHDEMLQKVREKTALNDARMEMALDSVDTKGMQIEEDAEKLRAAELVKQFKQEMGFTETVPPENLSEGGPEKTIGRREQV